MHSATITIEKKTKFNLVTKGKVCACVCMNKKGQQETVFPGPTEKGWCWGRKSNEILLHGYTTCS